MSHTFGNLPAEMREYRQWIVWRFEESEGKKPTKNLYSPLFKTQANVQEPTTWATFDEAVEAYETGGWNGIGFVFTRDDPFSGIDLDDTNGDEAAYQRQLAIFQAFPSYTELSPSGTGLHIIVKGTVERGRRRSKIELYPHERFFTCTGNVYRDMPITDCQEQLTILYNEMGGPAEIHDNQTDMPEREDDNTILSRMFEAVNGQKARDLYEGRWQEYYPDSVGQSEADFALVDIIAFYTQNRFQIVRIFHASALGQRDKAKRIDYMYRMINRAFDRQLPPIDTDAIKIQIDEMIAKREADAKAAAREGPHAAAAVADQPPGTAQNNGTSSLPYDPARVNPPGLVGEIADFIYQAAPRPVYEIALAGAIGLVAGVSARAFNVSGSGLNQYIMLIASTGTGKEAMNSGISKIMQGVIASTPSAANYQGPGEIRSDAALLKWLSREPCMFTIAGEIGLRLKQMAAPNASSHEIGLKRVLLDLYSKSGFGQQLNPMAYSDKEKNTEVIYSPAFTMIGESTPERFYEALDEAMVTEGLLPRMTMIEYNGPRPSLNKGAWNATPSFGLIDRLGALIAHCTSLQAGKKGIHVAYTPEAEALLDAFDKYCDAEWNKPSADKIHKELWTRAHMKAMRLAATVAVGCDIQVPTIDRHTAQWATDLVVKDITNLLGRFERGEVGGHDPYTADEMKQLDDLIRSWAKLIEGPVEQAVRYGLLPEMHYDRVVTATTLSRYVSKMASFRKDRIGAAKALDRALKHLLDGGEISELPKSQCQEKYGPKARAFAIERPARFFQ